MKYRTIIETDEFEGFEFYEDGNGKYMVGKDAGATAGDRWIPLYFTECEQESIPDKIKAEIEEQVLESLSDGGDDWFAAEKINECLEIIDKYRESEGEDANN